MYSWYCRNHEQEATLKKGAILFRTQANTETAKVDLLAKIVLVDEAIESNPTNLWASNLVPNLDSQISSLQNACQRLVGPVTLGGNRRHWPANQVILTARLHFLLRCPAIPRVRGEV
jgi:hypothetical protein